MEATKKSRRPRWSVVLGTVAGVVAVALVVAWFVAPVMVRRYVEQHYKGVHIQGGVTLSFRGVALHGVEIDREGVKAQLPLVRVLPDESVVVEGGTATLTLTEKPGGGNSDTKRRVVGWLDAATVVQGDVKGTATKVTFDDFRVCAEKVEAQHPKGSVSGATVCVRKDRTLVTAEALTATPSFKLPYIDKLPAPTPKDITVTGVEFKPKEPSVSVKTATFGPVSVKSGYAAIKSATVYLMGDVTLDLAVLHTGPITLKDVSTKIPVADLANLTKIPVQIGPARVVISPGDMSLEGDAKCQAWVDALPTELRTGPLATMRLEGSLSFTVAVKPPTPTFKMKADCHASCEGFKPLSGKFTYTAYDADGKEFVRTTGPGTKDWTPIGEVSATLPAAVMSTEDPGFLGHKGVIPEAIENSLRDDLKADRFVRGGSTITMQLVKNVWLRRTKTLGRKTQEVLLSLAIESCLSKDVIMETYLNVVEFGPNLYGVGPASQHYFGEAAMTLDPVRSYYLASILPAPRKAPPPNTETLERIRSLMIRVSKESGQLSDTFGAPSPQDEEGWVVNKP